MDLQAVDQQVEWHMKALQQWTMPDSLNYFDNLCSHDPPWSSFCAPQPTFFGDLPSYDTTVRSSEHLRAEGHKGRQRGRYTPDQRRVLDKWVESNKHSPYLDAREKQDLSAQLGLSETQVANYISNYRRRKLGRCDQDKATSKDCLPQSPSGLLATMEEQQFGTSTDGSKTSSSASTLYGLSLEVSPASPWNEEPVDEHEKEADEDLPMPVDLDGVTVPLGSHGGSVLDWYLDNVPPSDAPWDMKEPSPTPLNPPDLVELGYSPPHPLRFMDLPQSGGSPPDMYPDAMSLDKGFGDYHSEAGSGCSSASSHRSYTSLGARSGRRAYGSMTGIGDNFTATGSSKVYACEHCLSTFSSKYSRNRHVLSIHEASQTWTCQPLIDQSTDLLIGRCERTPECWARPLDERTFYRRDNLVQHLKGFHSMPPGLVPRHIRSLEMDEERRNSTLQPDILSKPKLKKHPCTVDGCTKSYALLTHLKIHLRSHTGEKPYKCSFEDCTTTFLHLGNLRVHERRHQSQGNSLKKSKESIQPGQSEQNFRFLTQSPECSDGTVGTLENRLLFDYKNIWEPAQSFLQHVREPKHHE